MVLTTQPSRSAVPVRIGLLLAILSGAPFLASLDLFVVNVAFDDIGKGFPGHSLGEVSWILNGYAIVYAALLIPLGRWADKVGHKRGFLIGLGLFTLASAACAVSPSLWALVGFRLAQAVGAAALTPTSLGLLIRGIPAEKRAMSVRIWAATGAAASAFGPVVGGLLVELSWRWIFLINVPFGVALVAAAIRFVPDYRSQDSDPELDLVGAVLLAIGIGALTLGLVEGHSWGWGSAGIIASFILSAVAVAAFAVNNARHRSPLIAPALLRVRTFAWANAAALLFSASFAAGLLSGILWMQQVWGYSAVRTGLAVAPGPLMVPVFAIGAQRLARRVPAGLLACAGSVLWAAGTVLMLTSVGSHPHYAAEMLPGWMLCGVGVGLTLPTILSSATAALPAARAATGSAVVNMSRQIGTVLGTSILIALLGTPIGYAAAQHAFQRAWWAVVIVGLLSAVVAIGLTPRRSEHPS